MLGDPTASTTSGVDLVQTVCLYELVPIVDPINGPDTNQT